MDVRRRKSRVGGAARQGPPRAGSPRRTGRSPTAPRWCPVQARSPRVCSDSAIRYSPTGHPSARVTSSAAWSPAAWPPGPPEGDGSRRRRTPGQRHPGRTDAPRPAHAPPRAAAPRRLSSATCEPSGTPSATACSTSWHSGRVSSWMSSTTRTKARSREAANRVIAGSSRAENPGSAPVTTARVSPATGPTDSKASMSAQRQRGRVVQERARSARAHEVADPVAPTGTPACSCRTRRPRARPPPGTSALSCRRASRASRSIRPTPLITLGAPPSTTRDDSPPPSGGSGALGFILGG